MTEANWNVRMHNPMSSRANCNSWYIAVRSVKIAGRCLTLLWPADVKDDTPQL